MCHSHENTTTTGLQTWALDWSLQGRSPRFLTILYTFKAFVNHDFGINDEAKDFLSVQGIKLDTIKYCTETYDIVGHVKYQEYGPTSTAGVYHTPGSAGTFTSY